jgi:hypothetical protein
MLERGRLTRRPGEIFFEWSLEERVMEVRVSDHEAHLNGDVFQGGVIRDSRCEQTDAHSCVLSNEVCLGVSTLGYCGVLYK